MIAVVIKAFKGHKAGDLVDASGFKNRERMFATRILRTATPDEVIAFKRSRKSGGGE